MLHCSAGGGLGSRRLWCGASVPQWRDGRASKGVLEVEARGRQAGEQGREYAAVGPAPHFPANPRVPWRENVLTCASTHMHLHTCKQCVGLACAHACPCMRAHVHVHTCGARACTHSRHAHNKHVHVCGARACLHAHACVCVCAPARAWKAWPPLRSSLCVNTSAHAPLECGECAHTPDTHGTGAPPRRGRSPSVALPHQPSGVTVLGQQPRPARGMQALTSPHLCLTD